MNLTNTASTTTIAPLRRHTVERYLDGALERIVRGDGFGAVSDLVAWLDAVLRGLPQIESELTATLRSHELHSVLLQDPYTARAFNKPRGYAGDAVMLDFIYDGVPPAGTTDVGAAVFRATTRSPAARSVAHRRDLLAEEIDRTAAEVDGATVLSVACGHLREAARSKALAGGRQKRFVAIDHDPESLAVVACAGAELGIEPVRESVGGLLKGRTSFVDVDLAYAAGLFDYLDDHSASLLVERLFQALRPGGRLLVANFRPGHHGRGYMASAMDWKLILRDEQDLAALAGRVDRREVSGLRTFTDPGRNVAYVEIRRSRQ